MSISKGDLPSIIVERIEASFPAPAIFSGDEILHWPDGTLRSLEAAGVFQQAERADAVICDGCAWCCFKPVVVRTSGRSHTARAFIVCDEEPDYGRIDVGLDRIQQYRTTLSLLAGFLRGALSLAARASLTGTSPFLLGYFGGRQRVRSVSLLIENQAAVIMIGTQSAPVLEFLCWSDTGLTVDQSLLRKVANRKQAKGSSRKRYQSDRTKQQGEANDTARRDRAIRAAARQQRRETGKNPSEISRELARQGRFRRAGPGKQPLLTAVRILRIMYDPPED